MSTITEDYVSFEIAKLLKEKGFNEPCLKQYYNNGELSNVSIEAKYNIINNQISASTHQMAMKWLRKVHNIDICVFPYQYDYIGYSYKVKIYKNKEIYLTITDYKTYEDAAEEAILYCLKNLI